MKRFLEVYINGPINIFFLYNDYYALKYIGCTVLINGASGLPNPQPLFLVPGTNRFFTPETRNGTIPMASMQTMELFCSDAGFAAPFQGLNTLMAQCQANNQFLVNGRSIPFNQLRCIDQVRHTARRSARTRFNLCLNNVTQIEVGFLVGNRFIWTMEICFDEVVERTHFTYAPLTTHNLSFQRSMVRPFFTGGTFFGGRNVDQLYTGNQQRITMNGIIGAARVNQLWDNSRDFFLARGHLAARADFIFETQQRTSFYLMNAAPQWQSFNDGNWVHIENGVRNFLSQRNIDAEVYTGTFGILELADTQGIPRQLFLSFNNQNQGRIPVPQFYYKIVIGTRSRRGIAFVGVNNPHATWAEINSGRFSICRDVSNQVTFVNWRRNDLTMGYSYACDVNELAAVLRHLPADRVRTTGLLV